MLLLLLMTTMMTTTTTMMMMMMMVVMMMMMMMVVVVVVVMMMMTDNDDDAFLFKQFQRFKTSLKILIFKAVLLLLFSVLSASLSSVFVRVRSWVLNLVM